jgi:hypothetical protein
VWEEKSKEGGRGGGVERKGLRGVGRCSGWRGGEAAAAEVASSEVASSWYARREARRGEEGDREVCLKVRCSWTAGEAGRLRLVTGEGGESEPRPGGCSSDRCRRSCSSSEVGDGDVSEDRLQYCSLRKAPAGEAARGGEREGRGRGEGGDEEEEKGSSSRDRVHTRSVAAVYAEGGGGQEGAEVEKA